MFFPSPSEIINRTISSIESIKNGEHEKTYSESEPWEDLLRKTYGDGNKRYMFKSGSKFRRPKTVKIVEGKNLEGGFRQFLSNHGKTTHLLRFRDGVPQDEPVDFDSLIGKTLVICCFTVPVRTMGSRKCRAVIDAFKEFQLSEIDPLELVVVAYMKTNFDYDLKAAFYHFYSAFSCLAIPFTDFETRGYIHSSMSRSLNHDLAMLVNPKGVILHNDNILNLFYYYGSVTRAPSSFTDTQDDLLRSALDPMYPTSESLSTSKQFDLYLRDLHGGHLSLSHHILVCPSSLTLHRFDAPETDVSSTVGELSRKYVGLYLCINGSIMEEIKAAHDHCLANNQQLEIVLVPLPFYDEPKLYDEDLRGALRRLNIKSWFILDYSSNVCRRLWRIFGQGSVWLGEKFIIIPPDCKSGELCGREVIANFGVDQYPFTRTAILKRRLEHLRSLTPVFSSVFNNCLLIQKGKQFKSEQLLKGKNVLLYIGLSESGGLYDLLKKHYCKIKAMGWEVVFVLLKYEQRLWNGEIVEPDYSDCPFLLQEMPWPSMRLSAAAQASIKKKLIFPEDFKTRYLFAVGKDGKIVSRDVEHRLDTLGVTKSLFDDVLERDLAYGLAKIPLFDDGY